jgi:hypothetical protein
VTSHYLRCIVKDSFDKVFEVLSDNFGEIYGKKFYKLGESPRGVILGEHYFFRVSNAAALLVTLEEVSDRETRIELIACAAGRGLTDVSYGAHDSYVHTVEDYLVQSGFHVEVEKEISYFDRTKPTN